MRKPRLVRRYGSTSLLIDWAPVIDPAINASVHRYAAALRGVRGVSECVPAYASLLVSYSREETDYDSLAEQIYSLSPAVGSANATRLHILPVCYGEAYGPELPYASQRLGLSEDTVIGLHTAPTYQVYFLGFRPGFAFLGALDERLALPRLDSPRARVPAGSVGITGRQTGVYPGTSPGGWAIIGRCPLPLLDPGSGLPLLRPGDRVRFATVTSQRFDELLQRPDRWQAN